jgi:hypothetical protein
MHALMSISAILAEFDDLIAFGKMVAGNQSAQLVK